MDDICAVVCAFCGSKMRVNREMPASSDSHALRFFMCDTCGASEVRIARDDDRLVIVEGGKRPGSP